MSELKHRKPASGAVAAPSSSATKRHSDTSAANASIFSPNVSKARGEKFFLGWGAVWISMMATIVITRMFEDFTPNSYMIVGLLIAVPPMVLPLLFPGSDRNIHWTKRYTTKANVWIFIMSWVANYLWTHYFYHVLGTSYTFRAWRLNDVPFALYLITHSYFHFYHVLSNIALRWAWRRFDNKVNVTSFIVVSILIGVLSYVVAFMETFTIQHFQYYHIPDRHAMYVYGSMFYALYFFVSFPMFLRMDEGVDECWSLARATIDGMGACMAITQLLDFWRLSIGPIVDLEAARASALLVRPKGMEELPAGAGEKVPFIY